MTYELMATAYPDGSTIKDGLVTATAHLDGVTTRFDYVDWTDVVLSTSIPPNTWAPFTFYSFTTAYNSNPIMQPWIFPPRLDRNVDAVCKFACSVGVSVANKNCAFQMNVFEYEVGETPDSPASFITTIIGGDVATPDTLKLFFEYTITIDASIMTADRDGLIFVLDRIAASSNETTSNIVVTKPHACRVEYTIER